ncbi:CHAT domain-containing protein [Sphingomonas sp. ABOLH]|uniref:CHAT domain-containing protein n=1 Tax=Sphingomonas sp. ABOLH TaxID=1985881 RepID=UPI000F7D76D6|nr:CHAT domain-containing protein [Sphingomonas sp. ABOLH]RSV18391.1 CHAT domain-containing protein [Sphingomonas sp. ABOLH]
MQSDQYKRDIANLDDAASKLRNEIGKQEKIAGDARAEANAKRAAAGKTKSKSTADMHLRSAKTHDGKVAAAEKKIGELQAKLSANAKSRLSKEQNLRSALKREQTAADSAAKQRLSKEKSQQAALDRDSAKRRRDELNHARELGRLGSSTVTHVMIPAPEPEKLRLLYLTASPLTDGAAPLRVDAEVNLVLKVIRGAKYRDQIDIEVRPAATVEDLLNGLNDHRPHVVHFSGHAGGGLLFDNASVTDPGEHLVGYKGVARLLKATDHPPTLVVLNACRTLEGVDELLKAASVVIAMSDTVGDASAAIFATHFYGGIAAAQSIGFALDQAGAMVAIALPDEPELAVLRSVDGIDPYAIQLIALPDV